jgi:predicted deacylase
VAHRLGRGPAVVILVGGLHGGYEANSVVLARRFVDYFQQEGRLPDDLTLYVIPDANPDGTALVEMADGTPAPPVFEARFNGNGVDLNRNWDCQWTADALWRDQAISAGTGPFSEPETQALRDFFLTHDPALVLFFHSAAGAVYASGCPQPEPESLALAERYGAAAGYPVHAAFDHYAITGDAADWLTTQGIPSFTVELSTHETVDWEQNLAGVTAVLGHLARE